MRRTMSCPSGLERFTVTDFLPRFALAKYADSVVSLPLASFSHGGPNARESSPLFGRSIVITSAPSSARCCPVQGAASTRDRSITLIWDSGPAITVPLQSKTSQIERLRYCVSDTTSQMMRGGAARHVLSETLHLRRLTAP